MKKVISLFLSLAMLLSIVSVVDFSAYADVQTGSCGDNVTYSLDTSTGVLTISGTGKMKDYFGRTHESNHSPFYYNSYIKSIIIENSVTSIGDDAFYGCTSLTSVTIPYSVTSIGYDAFYDTAYYNDESNWNNGVLYISDCLIDTNDDFDSTTDYTIKGGTRIIADYAFLFSKSLTSVTIPDSVTSIGDQAFNDCTNLTNATIGNGVTSIGEYAFNGCTSLKSVTIPNSITSIDEYAFLGCTSLKFVTYNGTKSQCKSIEGYYNISKIIKCTDGIIGGGNTVTIDSLKYIMYYDTVSLVGYTVTPENLMIPENISYKDENENYEFKVTSIGSSAFKNCTSLTSITIPDSVTTIGNNAFSGCSSLTSVTIGNSVTSIGSSAFDGCTSLASVTIGNSVTSIGSSAFSGCTSLKSFNYCGTKSQWKAITIGSDNYYLTHAFIKCNDGIIGNGNTVTINNLKYIMYYDTVSLVGYTVTPENLMIPKSVLYEGYTFKVTSIGESAFKNCTSLTSVTIGNSVTSIGNEAFYGCTSLTSVTIPDSVTSIGDYAFCNCTSLTSVTIPDSVTSIGYSAFRGCTSLTSVTIPDSVTSIGDAAFKNCTSLTSLTIPDSVTSIGKYAFSGCTSLTSITIPDSVTSISYSAFENCTSLSSVTIGNSVTSIGSSTLSGCSNLKSVNYNGTKAQWKSISGYGNVSQIIKCTDGIYANSSTIIIDSVKYRLNDDYTAEVISCSGTPRNITILESVTYEGLTFKVTSIGSSAFFGCSKLKKIEIPDSVTYIGSKAFDGTAFYNTVKNWEDGVLYCGNHLISAKSDVTKITVKASTVSIAAGALDNCKSLEKINVLNPKCVINCTIPKTAVIGGAEGSTAEDFAQKNNMSIDYFEECTHSDKVQVVIAATCTEQGAVQSRCADCDKLISQTFTAPLGHTMVITTPAKAPTCTTSGNTQAGYCTVCGYNEVSTVIPATGHNFGNNSANCLVCGAANPNYVAPTQPTPSTTPSTTPTQPNQNDTNTSNDEDVTVISKPKSASIKKVKGAKKAILVTWIKVSGVSGYEIQLATNKKFKKNKKTVTIKKQKTTKTTVKKLKAKKKYYVRIRTYKIVNGKKVYSSWSKVKSVKTK